MILLRSIAFNAVFYIVTIVLMVVGLPVLFASSQTIRNFARLWSRVSIWLLARICHVRVEYRGAENVPAGGYLLAAKHQSFLDILALVSLTPRFVFVLKRELTWIPLFGLFLLRAGMIPIDRSKGRAVLGDLTERVGAAVHAGDQLIIFPEGTRRPPGAEPIYKSGISHLYAGTNVPCLPVALNSGVFWRRRSFLRHPGTMVVDMLPAIEPGLEKAAFLDELRHSIETASNRLLAEAGFSSAAGS